MRKPRKPPGRGSDQFVLRFPDGMRDRITRSARENGRSINSEIISRLEKSYEDDDVLLSLEGRVEELEKMVSNHDAHIFSGKYED
jgi:hypothetical protein